jgi:hypothetical protein
MSVDLNDRRFDVRHRNAPLTIGIDGGRACYADFNSCLHFRNREAPDDDMLIWLFDASVTMFEKVRELCESL